MNSCSPLPFGACQSFAAVSGQITFTMVSQPASCLGPSLQIDIRPLSLFLASIAWQSEGMNTESLHAGAMSCGHCSPAIGLRLMNGHGATTSMIDKLVCGAAWNLMNEPRNEHKMGWSGAAELDQEGCAVCEAAGAEPAAHCGHRGILPGLQLRCQPVRHSHSCPCTYSLTCLLKSLLMRH